MSLYGPCFFELSFSRSREQFEGSSFKPLSLLAYHPWVRTSNHRKTLANSNTPMPRLPFLMQYYYLHGEYPPSSVHDDNGQGGKALVETEDPATDDHHDSHSQSADEISTTSETSSEGCDSPTISHVEVENVDSTVTPHLSKLPYVLRPSCHRSPSSSSTTSDSSSCSFRSFRSKRPRRQSFETSPTAGLSAFHDVFATSICPSTDIIFPVSTSHHRRSSKDRRTEHK